MQTKRVEAGDISISYVDHGSGPPLVLLHGGLATAAMSWTGRYEELGRHFRVLAPDSRGQGETTNPSGHLSYDQMADDVVAFCAALGIEQPLVLGYSDGGQTGIELALRHPGFAKALVLGGTISERTESYVEALHNWGFTEPGSFDEEKLAAEFGPFLNAIKSDHKGNGEPEYWRILLPQIATLWLTVPSYSTAQLASIKEPVLVIMGDRDDMAGEGQATRLYRGLGNAELAIVPNADHSAGMTDLFWANVIDFLRRKAGLVEEKPGW